jgi:Organic solute transporter Ostalpha
MPQVQMYVVRILWMVPIYAVEAWLSLRFRDFSLYLKAFRESKLYTLEMLISTMAIHARYNCLHECAIDYSY